MVTYGIEVFGKTAKSNIISKIQRIQHKIIKVLYKKEWLTPTNDLHKELKLLQIIRLSDIMDIYKLFILNFVNKHETHCLPDAFHNYFMLRSEIHNRITRGAIDIHIPKANNNLEYQNRESF